MGADDLSLVTLNTWKCDGDYYRRLPLMRAGMAALAPEIAVLQEVFALRGDEPRVAMEAAQALGARLSFERARYARRRLQGKYHESWSGMATLSRLPVLRSERLELPTHRHDGERVAQLSVIDPGGGALPLLVINAHLTYLRNADSTRIRQLCALFEHPLMAGAYSARFLCGDLNDTPDGATLRWLREQAPLPVVDCYEAVHPGAPRVSVRVEHEACADPAHAPNFDYVLLLGQSQVELTGADYVFDQPGPDGLYPSDHLGVRVRFRLR